MPLYALRLDHDVDRPESGLLDSGTRSLYVHGTFEWRGESWEVVELKSHTLDTPEGIQVVKELRCVPAATPAVSPLGVAPTLSLPRPL